MSCTRAFLRKTLRLAIFCHLVFCLARVDAADCGDDVGGVDIPCACGDFVVSDVVLDDDPVTNDVCSGDGLVIRAPHGSAGVLVDLAGAVLRGGARGTGIRILAGGERGTRIISTGAPARIEGFRDGLVSQTRRFALAEAVDLHVYGPQRDGVRIYGDGLLLRDLVVEAAGRDGAFVRGDGWAIQNVVVRQNGRNGLTVMGAGNTIRAIGSGDSVRAEANAADGIRVWGEDNQLFDCIAASNGENGVGLNGVRLDVRSCRALANGDGGLRGSASQSRFFGNVAFDNLDAGIGVHGHAVFDAGLNYAAGNSESGDETPAVQCELGQEACR